MIYLVFENGQRGRRNVSHFVSGLITQYLTLSRDLRWLCPNGQEADRKPGEKEDSDPCHQKI